MPSSPKFVNRKFKLPAQSPHCRMACGCFAEQNMNCRRFPTNSATPKFLKTSPAQCGKFAKRIMQTPNLMLKKAPTADILYRRNTTITKMKDEETICG